MARYKAKPCEIESIQFDGNNIQEIENFAKRKYVGAGFKGSTCYEIEIETSNGIKFANVGSYIIKEPSGEFYIYQKDVFEKKYEIIIE